MNAKMNAAGRRNYVIDASVILKWFSQADENNLDKALQLRKEFRERNINLYAPELLI